MAAQGAPPPNLPTAQPPGARSGGGQRSPHDRIKAEAARTANGLLPKAPDASHITAALALAGVVVDPANDVFTQIMARAAAGYQEWQPSALESLAGAIQRAAMASPGSVITPRACAAIFAAWDAGVVFEQRALDEVCSALNVDAAAVNLSRALVASSQYAALCSTRSLHGEIDPEADLLKAALECAGADAASAAAVRTALLPYEEERARRLRSFAEAEVRTQSRNGEVAGALQAWATARKNADNDNQTTMPIEGIAMTAMLAPTIEAGRGLLALHARGAQALEAAAPGEVTWCAYVWLVNPAASSQARQAMESVRQTSVAVDAKKAAAIAALAGDFRAAEIAQLRAAVTAHIAEIDKTLSTLRPFLGTGPVTAETIELVVAAMEADPTGQVRLGWHEARTKQRERQDAFETQVRAIADAP